MSGANLISRMPAQDVRNRLEPGERVLWQGGPNVRRFVLRGSAVMIPFAVVWLAFALFWVSSAVAAGAPPFFLLWGSLFVMFGLYISVGRFVLARREAVRTEYVLTDRRLLMRTGAFASHRQELSLRSMPTPVLDERDDGVGTITFGTVLPYQAFVGAGWPGAGRMTPAFVTIDDAARVFRLIDDARAQAIADSNPR